MSRQAPGIDIEVRPQRGQPDAMDPGSTVLKRSVFWCNGPIAPFAAAKVADLMHRST